MEAKPGGADKYLAGTRDFGSAKTSGVQGQTGRITSPAVGFDSSWHTSVWATISARYDLISGWGGGRGMDQDGGGCEDGWTMMQSGLISSSVTAGSH